MGNELIHKSQGTVLTQAEYENIDAHILNSQATGDLIYASSATQLTRLGIGATNTILTTIGGVPTWQSTLAGLTLTSPTINGTIATTGLTLPAHQSGNITLIDASILRNADNGYLYFYAGTTGDSASLTLYGKSHATYPGLLRIQTPNAALGATTRLEFSVAADIITATWSAVTHTGLDITSGQVLKVAGTQVVSARGAAVADATDAPSVILRLNELLARVRTHGLIAAA